MFRMFTQPTGPHRRTGAARRGGARHGAAVRLRVDKWVPILSAALLGVVALSAGCAEVPEYSLPSNTLEEGQTGALLTPEALVSGTEYDAVAFGMRYFLYDIPVEDTHVISLTGGTSDLSWELYDPTLTVRLFRCDYLWATGDESCTITASDYVIVDPDNEEEEVSLLDAGIAGLTVTEWDSVDGTFTLTIDVPPP